MLFTKTVGVKKLCQIGTIGFVRIQCAKCGAKVEMAPIEPPKKQNEWWNKREGEKAYNFVASHTCPKQ